MLYNIQLIRLEIHVTFSLFLSKQSRRWWVCSEVPTSVPLDRTRHRLELKGNSNFNTTISSRKVIGDADVSGSHRLIMSLRFGARSVDALLGLRTQACEQNNDCRQEAGSNISKSGVPRC